MKLFISAGEPSGDLHGSNLAHAITKRDPVAKLVGFGGEKMTAAGVDLIYPLTQLSIMWFGRSIVRLPQFFRLADQAEKMFRQDPPDAVVLIDYPGFHWHIAKRAKAAGLPVYYFVPPQLWAWGGWRTRKMRKSFDTILTALPFEDKWFQKKGLKTHYVGHPYFDELSQQSLDQEFISKIDDGRPVVALLPGSRNQEVSANFPLMLATAEKILARKPNVKFLVASFNEKQSLAARSFVTGHSLPIEFHINRTKEIIAGADACLAVSGSVGLELMYRGVPSAIVYKYTRLARWVSKQFITCPYISLVNLLAGEEIYPEFLTYNDCSTEMADQLLTWLENPSEAQKIRDRLRTLKDQVAIPGACERAADFLLHKLQNVKRDKIAA